MLGMAGVACVYSACPESGGGGDSAPAHLRIISGTALRGVLMHTVE